MELVTSPPNLPGQPQPSKPLDANRYATKKTIAQGMLDIALLTANASQLKYILQVGPRHEFYSLMLGLISTSMILQVSAGALSLYLATVRLDDREQRRRAKALYVLAVGCIMLAMTADVIKMGFGLDPALPYNASLRYYEPPPRPQR